jgi:hypothetical protein
MFHTELNYEIVRMRHEELVGEASRRRLVDRIRSRRRRPPAVEPLSSAESTGRRLVAVPPPQHDRDHTGRDPQVA